MSLTKKKKKVICHLCQERQIRPFISIILELFVSLDLTIAEIVLQRVECECYPSKT